MSRLTHTHTHTHKHTHTHTHTWYHRLLNDPLGHRKISLSPELTTKGELRGGREEVKTQEKICPPPPPDLENL